MSTDSSCQIHPPTFTGTNSQPSLKGLRGIRTLPEGFSNNVLIGDVGYLQDGSFICMLNVMFPWGHPSNRTFGDPEPYESLANDPSSTHYTLKGDFDRVDYYSRNVSAERNAGATHASSPEQ